MQTSPWVFLPVISKPWSVFLKIRMFSLIEILAINVIYNIPSSRIRNKCIIVGKKFKDSIILGPWLWKCRPGRSSGRTMRGKNQVPEFRSFSIIFGTKSHGFFSKKFLSWRYLVLFFPENAQLNKFSVVLYSLSLYLHYPSVVIIFVLI